MRLRIVKEYRKSLEPISSEIIRAIRKYELIDNNETIAVAVSGGKDSLILLYLLWYVNKYSYLNYSVIALHVRTDKYDTGIISDYCSALGIEYRELSINMERSISEKSVCYSCSRFKRVAMWEYMENHGIQKMALGHHAGDLTETFVMNLMEHSRIETLRPVVKYDKYPLKVIRPMLTIGERAIQNIFTNLELSILDYKCPYEENNIRDEYRQKVKSLDKIFGENRIEFRLVNALKKNNVRYTWE